MNIFAKTTKLYARTILIIAGILLIAGIGYGSGVFSTLTHSGITIAENSQSEKVEKFITEHGYQPDAVVLFETKDGSSITSPVNVQEMTRLLGEIPGATTQSYATTGSDSFVSRDNQESFATVNFKAGEDSDNFKKMDTFVHDYKSDLLIAHIGGPVVITQQITQQIEKDLVTAEVISLPILAILLLFFFRSVVAASLPLIVGIFAIVGGLSVVRLLTSFTAIDQYAINVITVLGLGLSVDYSLLMVSRFREEIKKHTKEEALRRTVLTAGRTILFSGLTVMVSLLVLTLFPVSFLRSVGLGGASALVVAMLAALTIMPAILLLVGNRIDRWRVGPHHDKKAQRERWRHIGDTVMRFPLLVSSFVIVIILVAASPALSVIFKTADYTVLPHGSSARIVGERLSTNFDDQKPPILVLYRHDSPISTPDAIADLDAITQKIAAIPGVHSAQSITTLNEQLGKTQIQYLLASGAPLPEPLRASIYDTHSTIIRVAYEGEPADKPAQTIVSELRTLSANNAQLEIGGDPAIHHDVVAAIGSRVGLALGVIAVAMFVLLALLLRSIVIPLAAIVINTFALLVTFGVLVLVFQFGFGTEWTWLLKTGGIDITIPVLIFAVAFGLSMDYAVFLYSRIREEYDKTQDTKEAILRGMSLTGPLITQAAVLLFVVVGAFASSGIAILQQVGLGLALTVLVDAFIVRTVFVPAVMQLFGRANWWAPKWVTKFAIRHE